MPKKQAFIDKSGVKFVENFQKNQKIKKFPSRTEIRYLTAFMQKSHSAHYAMLSISYVRYISMAYLHLRAVYSLAHIACQLKGNLL